MKYLWACVLIFAPLVEAERVPGLYFVELEGKPAAVAAKKGRQFTAQARAGVRAAQLQARQAIEQTEAVILASVDTVANGFIVWIPDARAAQLASIPGVVRVHQARTLKLLLDHAVPLMKVPDAWDAAGGMEKAGAGIKIGVIDTGIDQTHPGFQDASLTPPPGFPKVDTPGDQAFTNSKVIVARCYGSDATAMDLHGHGTAVAMAAAGLPNQGPLARIFGAAPKAFLGNYKVTSGSSGSTSDTAIIRALDDAVNDGMDVVNLSFGQLDAPRPSDDPLVDAIETAAAAGVLVTTAVGNEGPDPNTINSPASAPSAIAVGASTNDRTFATSVSVDGMPPVVAIPGSGPNSDNPITAPLVDVAGLDQTGLACGPLPAGSLSGKIALIARGTCTFEEKILNAQQVGAVAAVVYTDATRPDPVGMAVGSATLPSTMVGYADGVAFKGQIAEDPNVAATVQFVPAAFPTDPNLLASFSSRGPNPDLAIKPDLLAVGTSLYLATQTENPGGTLYDPGGYILEDGTSFSSPLVAGAAALVKQLRPGLTTQQYRSLLINSANAPASASGAPLPVQSAGGGVLNMQNAVRDTVTAVPTALSFGAGGSTVDLTRNLAITNVGSTADTVSIMVAPIGDGPAPTVSTGSLRLDPGSTQQVMLRFAASDLKPGEYQGFVQVQGSSMATPSRVPYWYAVPSDVPQNLTILFSDETDPAGRFVRDAIEFRITDASGIPILDANPTVTAISGGGQVNDVLVFDDVIPGAYTVNLTMGLGRGPNVFRIQAGNLTQDVTILSR